MKTDKLIVGESNAAAVAALRDADNTCFYFYGPTDTGKRYLAKMLRPQATVINLPGPVGLCDMLDAHWNDNRSVVMLAADPPRNVLANPRELTRVFRGVVMALAPWTEPMRAQYFTERTQGGNPKVRAMLLQTISGGPRILAGLATAWRAHNFCTDADELAKLLQAYGAPLPHKFTRIDPDAVLGVVCQHYYVSREDILSQRRTRNIALPRHAAIYLIKKLTNMTLADVGKCIGGRDHSTVLHAFNKMTALVRENNDVSKELAALAVCIQKGSHEQ